MASFFYSLLFYIFISPSIAQTSFRPKALVLPVTKDSATGQYITQLKQRTPLVPVKLTVDLGAQSMWIDCKSGYVSSSLKPVHCHTAQCSLTSSSCGDCVLPGTHPHCNICMTDVANMFITTVTMGDLSQDIVSIQSTNGSNPGKVVTVPNLLFTCINIDLLGGLAAGVKGMAGIGRTKIGLPTQFASAFSFKRKFVICLSSSTRSKGVIFFGDGPYVLLPNIDVSKSLTFTPLFKNHGEGKDPSLYYIGVKSISINEKAVPLNKTLLSIDRNGYGGTKMSTIDLFTKMETSIYKAFIQAFANELKDVPKVAPVAPFELCYNSKSFASTRLGPRVPSIELVLQNKNVVWRIHGANSMVEVSKDVLCVAFVDGATDPNLLASIVIGGHQLEDNLLQFDLAASRLGFSSSLLGRQTSCANFNFTSTT